MQNQISKKYAQVGFEYFDGLIQPFGNISCQLCQLRTFDYLLYSILQGPCDADHHEASLEN